MRKIYIFLILTFSSLILNAQWDRKTKYILGVAGSYAYPLGELNKQASGGIGIDINSTYILSKRIALGIDLSYSKLGQEDNFWLTDKKSNYKVNYHISSIFLRGVYFIDAWDVDFKPYASIGFGYLNYQQKLNYSYNYTNIYNNAKDTYTVKLNKPALNPSVGFMYYMDSNILIDMNVSIIYVASIPKTIKNPSRNSTAPLVLAFRNIIMPKVSLGIKYSF